MYVRIFNGTYIRNMYMLALTTYVLLIFHVDSINITIKHSQNIIGQRQCVICSVFVPSDVDPDVIQLAWRNEEDIITANSRVTIVNSTDDSSSINVITTIIQFDPLYEDDMGKYYCYSIINGSLRFASIQLQDFRSTYICNLYLYRML